ncbi:MAG: TetR/AcrR family transcriptional regulator [Desulfosarcina sp.]|nr:TetR/AcrR family transcriptional regulator [Desulfosarcina sp.]MBC2743426.1 TetR/AcrR family transcriptional regulator [Desulfosarcina sp.]MBC2766336.1 TetR/AcrR family transcriptional regulator [Desulfosarcina sp.]
MSDKKTTKAREIARTAFTVFSRNGYPLASVEQIAIEAGIGKSTVYEYYKTKEELFVAAIMEGAEDWIADLKEIGRKTHDPVQRLNLIADLYLKNHEEEQQPGTRMFVEVVTQTCLQGGVFYDRPHLIRELHQRIVRIMVDYLLAGVSRGQLRPGIARHAEKICINLMAYLDGILMHGLIEEGYINIREQIALFMEQMIPLLLISPDKSINGNQHYGKITE